MASRHVKCANSELTRRSLPTHAERATARTGGNLGAHKGNDASLLFAKPIWRQWRGQRHIKTGASAWSDASENVRLCAVENIPEMPVQQLLSASGCRRVPIASIQSQPRRVQNAGPVTVGMGVGVSEAR